MSREYSSAAIKDLVEDMRKKGWVFTYIGANQDVEKVAESTQSWNGWFKGGKWKDGMVIGRFTPNSTVTMIGNRGGFGPGGRGGFLGW